MYRFCLFVGILSSYPSAIAQVQIQQQTCPLMGRESKIFIKMESSRQCNTEDTNVRLQIKNNGIYIRVLRIFFANLTKPRGYFFYPNIKLAFALHACNLTFIQRNKTGAAQMLFKVVSATFHQKVLVTNFFPALIPFTEQIFNCNFLLLQ